MLFAGQLAVEAGQGDAEGLQRAHGVPVQLKRGLIGDDQSKRGCIRAGYSKEACLRLTNQKDVFLG